MAQTPSNMLPLGTKAPDFNLMNTVTNTVVHLNNAKGAKGTVIMFICNHCPFVIHVNPMLVSLANSYRAKGIHFIAISSNDVINYPQDAPHLMKQKAIAEGYPFPYLFDETQEIAKAYDAACTPDFYLFDEALQLTYRGQLDDSRPGNGIPLSGSDLIRAMDALLSGEPLVAEQKPSIGCNIKWIVKVFEHGTLEVEVYKPEKVDLQQPHTRDEVYIVIAGRGFFINDGVRSAIKEGDFLFVPAGIEHRFENFTDDFSTWVLFYGQLFMIVILKWEQRPITNIIRTYGRTKIRLLSSQTVLLKW